MRARPRPVHVLVDWNSELRASPRAGSRDEAERARRALKYVCRRVGRLLQAEMANEACFIFLRIYHGWRVNSTPTERRQALAEAHVYNPRNPDDRGLSEYSPHPRHVLRDLQFGDKLLGARDVYLCGRGHDHHLPSTCQKDQTGVDCEKMVDTALVSDLLHLAMETDGSWLIVVGQDADLVPGILTAEGLLYGTDRRVIFLARGGINNSNPKMADLICRR